MSQSLPVTTWEVLKLTIPQMGLMLCHLAVSMTDLWVCGQIDGQILAVLGGISQVFAFLMLVTSMVASGCMATVSRAVGAGLFLRARRYAGLVLCISLLAGSCVAALALLVLRLVPLHGLSSPELAPAVSLFVQAYALQLPFYYSIIILNSTFRAHKMVWLPFATLCLVALINYAGSVGCGLGRWGLPQLGYAGVAWSTVASSVLGFACNIALAMRRGIISRTSFASWRWNRAALPRLWRIGIPAALGSLAGQSGSMALLACVANMPGNAAETLAGMTLGMRIVSMLYFPVAAMGMTLAIMTGHLLGARRKAECYGMGLHYARRVALIAIVAAAALLLSRHTVARWFTHDQAAVTVAGIFLLVACAKLPLEVVGMLLQAVLDGAGATRLTSRITALTRWGICVPLAYALTYLLHLGATGIFVSMACAEATGTLCLLYLYRQKKWLGSL